MRLVITEKPSVAQSLAKVIGASDRRVGYLEGNGYLVSWCVGHLVESAPPEAYDERYRRWRYEDLPILPEEWKYEVSSSTKKQFEVLKKLMERKDVDQLICATDAGREGELIFRLVYHNAGCTITKEHFKDRDEADELWVACMADGEAVVRELSEKEMHPRPFRRRSVWIKLRMHPSRTCPGWSRIWGTGRL